MMKLLRELRKRLLRRLCRRPSVLPEGTFEARVREAHQRDDKLEIVLTILESE